MSALDQVLSHVDDHLEESVDRLFDLVRIESISTDPAYKAECQKAAEWLERELKELQFDASVRPTPGHPMVVAHTPDQDTGPHVLFYGHYDVQPVDPLELWDNPPFEPTIKELADGSKELTGRGTSDDKGQLLTFVEACRAWRAVTGKLPLNASIIFEGEEETGSPSLDDFLATHKDELKADLALVCDTSMWDKDTPAITVRLRGMMKENLVIKAADRDLHSGGYGSAARNPLHVLSKIIADLRDDKGRVQIPGFYDGVGELPADIKKQWDELGFDSEEFLGEVGLSVPAGEEGYSVLEQLTSRPTCEVNGIWGGYNGEGSKTVIPAEANAKFTFRLVDQQEPSKIREAFRRFVEARLPADCSVEYESVGGEFGPLVVDTDMPETQKVIKALSDEWNKEAALIGSGGSIPITTEFRRVLGMETLLVGFALEDDRIHSPNEKYDLKSFHKGIRSWVRIIAALGDA
ncbi:dipeptidase [uncultured Kiloniella sp.]|uniref:dipeptidase n=1 Tax=uncultured Kiloniella sp. TaxID=1133091 RepID=UPI0026144CA4|nr:dipeptidase [uncultured Kiloniella sp.]